MIGSTKVRRGLLIALMAVAMACPWAVSQVYADSNFIIEDYDIDISVNEDDTYVVTETLDVHFTYPSHGIYRDIPYHVTLDRDGKKSTFIAGIEDFEMLSDHKWEKESGSDFRAKIGDPNKFEDTDTVYKMRYVYDMKGDHLKGADEMFYNMVGTGWEAKDIEHVSFRVEFPKDIDPDKVGIKTAEGVSVPFECEKNKVITGQTEEDVLGGLTIRAVLPEGYFTKQEGGSNIFFYLLTAIMAALAFCGVMVWRKFGRDPKIIETEEFYPPEGMNPAEVAYLEKQSFGEDDVVSLLLSLADKGYLKITEKEVLKGRKKNKTKTVYEIEQLKPYDGEGVGEATFMDGLFDGGARSLVTMDDLEDEFYKTVDKVEEEIADKYEGMMYDKKAGKYAKYLKGVGAAAVIVFMALSKILNGSSLFLDGEIILSIVIYVASLALIMVGFFGLSSKINATVKGIFGFIGYPAAIAAGLALSYLINIMVGVQVIPFLIGMGMCFIIILVGQLCERKTDEYCEILGKIRGFKRFLKIAEKERLEMLAQQDPAYYYRTLAFAFAMGITAVYARNFSKLASAPPTWFETDHYYHSASAGSFDPSGLTTAISNMMDSVSSSMTSSPSSDSGGGSFSGGGGAGGGGGGSW